MYSHNTTNRHHNLSYTYHISADLGQISLTSQLHITTGKAVTNSGTEVLYEEPDFSQPQEQKKALDIKLEECPAYGMARKDLDINIEMEECPAYGTVQQQLVLWFAVSSLCTQFMPWKTDSQTSGS